MATPEEVVSYYQDLLIIQYNDKPNALATIDLLVSAVIADLIPIDVGNAFDLETAVGVQLDGIGEYAGVVRRGFTFTGPVELDDADFRSLIKIAIARNYSYSSLFDIQALLNQFFADALFVFDYKNMRMSYFFDETVGSRQLAEVFVFNNLLPKPMGVQLGSLIYAETINSFFGYVSYDFPTQVNASPYNTYDDYELDRPYLNYSDAVVI
jgi:hypothetical protein